MEFAARILVLILRFIGFLVTPILKLYYVKRQCLGPEIVDPLLLRSATSLVTDIKSRKVKSSDLVKIYIERIQKVNPVINAVIEDRFKDALNEADKVDELVKHLSHEELWTKYPLLGVPITIKEPCRVKGLSYTGGDPRRAGTKATEDGKVVHYLRESGAIILCVTNVPEWVIGWESANPLFGRTLNPYDNWRTASGSSGGEAALIASAGSIIGLGSDMAGSIRTCAAFCGIFGHKPTASITSVEGFWPPVDNPKFDFWHNLGPLTRYSEDLKLMLQVVAGPNAALLKLNDNVDVGKINIYFMEDFGKSFFLTTMPAYMKDMVHQVVNSLRDLGCETKKMPNHIMEEAFEICSATLFHMKGVPELLNKPGDKGSRSITREWIKHVSGKSIHSYGALYFWNLMKIKDIIVPERKLVEYEVKSAEMNSTIRSYLNENSVLIVPTYTGPAFWHYLLPPHLSCLIYTTIFNVLGYPATHVPIKMVKGMPIGIQVVGAPHQDSLCLAVARELETIFGGWKPPA